MRFRSDESLHPASKRQKQQHADELGALKKQIECRRCHKLTRLCARQAHDHTICCYECILRIFEVRPLSASSSSSAAAAVPNEEVQARYNASPVAIDVSEMRVDVRVDQAFVGLREAFVALEQPAGNLLLDAIHLLDPAAAPTAAQDSARGLACRACQKRFPPGEVNLASLVEHYVGGDCHGLAIACPEPGCAVRVQFKDLAHHQTLHQGRALLDELLKNPVGADASAAATKWQRYLAQAHACQNCLEPLLDVSPNHIDHVLFVGNKAFHPACLPANSHIFIHAPGSAVAPPAATTCTTCADPVASDSVSIQQFSPRCGFYHPQCFADKHPNCVAQEMVGWGLLVAADKARISGMWGVAHPPLSSSSFSSMPSLQAAAAASHQTAPPIISRPPPPPPLSLPQSLPMPEDDTDTGTGTPPCGQPHRPNSPINLASQHKRASQQDDFSLELGYDEPE